MSTPAILRTGVVIGWVVLAGFALAMAVMVAQAAYAMGFALPHLQSPVAAGHQLGEQIGRGLASHLGGG